MSSLVQTGPIATLSSGAKDVWCRFKMDIDEALSVRGSILSILRRKPRTVTFIVAASEQDALTVQREQPDAKVSAISLPITKESIDLIHEIMSVLTREYGYSFVPPTDSLTEPEPHLVYTITVNGHERPISC